MFKEMNNVEMMEVDGGIGLLGAILIGACCVVGGVGLGLGTAYVVSKI